MKVHFYIPFCTLCLLSCGQQAEKQPVVAEHPVRQQEAGARLPENHTRAANDTSGYQEAIGSLRKIFEAYTANEEGIDSEDNKKAVTDNLRHLGAVSRREDLLLLINMWHYYDPTDYSCRQMIQDILLRDKPAAIAALEYRMQHRYRWETGATEFPYLLAALKGEEYP